MYNLSYPLKKQAEAYNSFITPKLSYRFSPNMTKNLSKKDRKLDIANINTFDRLCKPQSRKCLLCCALALCLVIHIKRTHPAKVCSMQIRHHIYTDLKEV